MAELDELLDSLIQKRNASPAKYIDENDVGTLKIKQTSAQGQGVFTERFLSVDQPICALQHPTISAIASDFLPTTCYYCLIVTSNHLPIAGHGYTPLELKICNGCQVARFCNRDCQVKAWHAYHKYECKILRTLKQNLPPAIFRAVLRMVLLKDRDLLPEEEWIQITSLVAHEHLLAGGGRSNVTEMAEGIKILAATSMTVDMIQKLIFIMKFNAIELPTPIYGGIGVMMVPLIGKINHSCEPNVAIRRPQHTMTSGWLNSPQLAEGDRNTFIQIVPLRDIGEGEELFNCYIAPTESVETRKAKSMQDYLFECNCTRCLADINATTTFSGQQPILAAQFEQWTKDMRRHLSQIGPNSMALQKAAACMDKFARFSEYPALYSTGEFPQMAMEIVLQGLKAKAFDVSAVNLFRIHFLVNPHRFVGRHNPTNTYTMFLMLDVLDMLLGDSNAAEVPDESFHALSTRGISKHSLVFWRRELVEDLRGRLEQSALSDLSVLLGERKRQATLPLHAGQTVDEEDEVRKAAEEEIRAALKFGKAELQTCSVG